MRFRITAAIGLLTCWLCFIAPAQIQTGGAQPKGPQDGTIEGRVISAASGNPLPDVTVITYGGGRQPGPVQTDAQGHFRFDKVNAVRFGVQVSEESGYFSRAVFIDLRTNHNVKGIELKAYKSSVIAGRVLDSQRRPVAGVTIQFTSADPPGARYSLMYFGGHKTNDLGEYRLTDILPGRYRLVAKFTNSGAGFKTISDDKDPAAAEPKMADVPTFYPSSSTPEGALVLTIGTGQDLEGTDIILSRQETFCVQSKVSNPGGRNATPIRVSLESDLYLGAPEVANGTVPSGVRFEVCGLPEGRYHLLARPAEGQADAGYAAQQFSITRQGMRLPDMQLESLVPVHGQLTIDAKDDQRTLSGPVRIDLRRNGAFFTMAEQPYVTVSSEGPFVIPAVLPDDYWLTVKPPSGYYVKSARIGGQDAWREQFLAGAGDLDIVLGQDGATLTVQVADADGRPVPGSEVILGRDPLAPGYGFDDVAVSLADDNGQAVFKSVAPGDYRLLAYDDLWTNTPVMSPDFFEAHAADGTQIKLDANGNRTVQFKVLHSQPQ